MIFVERNYVGNGILLNSLLLNMKKKKNYLI